MVEFQPPKTGEREMIAKMVDVHYDYKQKKCKDTGEEPLSNQIHLRLEPIEPMDWKIQNWWIYDSTTQGSTLHEVVNQFISIGLITEEDVRGANKTIDIFRKVKENLADRKLKFEEKRMGRAVGENWWPVEIVE